MERKSVEQIALALIAAFLLGWTACGDSGTDRTYRRVCQP